MTNRYVAGASGLPFAVLRGYAGTGLPRPHRRRSRPIACPFTGEELAAVPALHPDVAIIHAQQADRSGNVQLWGITGVQKEAVLARRPARSSPSRRWWTSLALRPGRRRAALLGGDARWPTSPAAPTRPTRPGTRNGTTASTRSGTPISRDRETFLAWMRRHVVERGAGVTAADYTATEMMAVAAARAPGGRRRCASSGSARRARRPTWPARPTPPTWSSIYESGCIGAKPTRLPLSIGDGELAETADAVVSVPEIFNYWLQPGRIDVGFLGAAQIDRYANLNTTVVGPYDAAERAPAGRRRGAGDRRRPAGGSSS